MRKRADLFSAAIGIFISILIVFADWIRFKGITYTILGFYVAVRKCGGITNYALQMEGNPAEQASSSIIMAYIFLVMPLIIAVLLLIRSVLLFRHKNAERLTLIVYWIGFIYILSWSLSAYVPCAAWAAAIFLMIADYIGVRLIMERDEMNRMARELKRREREALLDKKRRMRFPGTYSKEFFTVIWINFRSHFTSYALFIISAAVSTILIYLIFGIQFVLGSMHTKIDFFGILMARSRMIVILKETVPLLLFITLMLFVLILSNYIKTRMKNYGIFISLGIRKKTLWLIIGLEYGACIIGSGAMGLLAGRLLFPVLERLLFLKLDMQIPEVHSYGLFALVSGVIFLLLVGLGTLINYHLFEGIDISAAIVKSKEREKLPRHLLIPGALLGLYYIVRAVTQFSSGLWGEQSAIFISFLLGCFLVLYCGGGIWFRWYLKKEQRKLPHLLPIVPWRSRFRTNIKYWFLLFVIHTFAVAVFLPRLSSCLIAEGEQEVFPYNYVCMAHENDTEFFQELNKEQDVQMVEYPMVRVNALLGVPYSWKQIANPGETLWPQGQHIGIPESAYQQLRAARAQKDTKKLGLTGKEIHIVYQQDCSKQAHPLDWYLNTGSPRLRAGAITQYTRATMNETYPQYTVKSQEKLILTGMFQSGEQENIVVFSDAYFKELQQFVLAQLSEADTPTRLVTINTGKAAGPALKKSLEEFGTKQVMDSSMDQNILPYYEREHALADASAERFLEVVISAAALLILLCSTLFVFYLKYSLDIEEFCERDQILKYIGMKEKQRNKLLSSDMLVYDKGTLLAALVVSAVFIVMIPDIRMFGSEKVTAYAMILLGVLLLYLLMHTLGMYLLKRCFRKKMWKR